MSDDLQRIADVRRLARSGAARARREDAALSLREMAKAVGTSTASISRWERDESVPRADAALRWAQVLEGIDTHRGPLRRLAALKGRFWR